MKFNFSTILLLVVIISVSIVGFQKYASNKEAFFNEPQDESQFYTVTSGDRNKNKMRRFVNMTKQCTNCKGKDGSNNSIVDCVCNNVRKPQITITKNCDDMYVGLLNDNRLACFSRPYSNTGNWDSRNRNIKGIEKNRPYGLDL